MIEKQIVLTIAEIQELAIFAGLLDVVDRSKTLTEDDIEDLQTEIAISPQIEEGVEGDKFHLRYAWYEEYPEEGVHPLMCSQCKGTGEIGKDGEIVFCKCIIGKLQAEAQSDTLNDHC